MDFVQRPISRYYLHIKYKEYYLVLISGLSKLIPYSHSIFQKGTFRQESFDHSRLQRDLDDETFERNRYPNSFEILL